MAGESADEVARRARAKAERLLRHADAYEKGAAGERATSEALAALPAEEWTVFHDLRWPGRPRANIDHVVMGPAGVFVIDSKNWSGAITVTGDVLRQNGYSRAAALDGVRAATDAIRGLVPSLGADAFVPVLCLTRETPIKYAAGGVAICTTATLAELITERPPVLSAEWLQYLRYELDMSTRAATEAARPSPAPSSRRQPAKRWTGARIAGLVGVVILVIAGVLLVTHGLRGSTPDSPQPQPGHAVKHAVKHAHR
jgi:hypothetical protein